MNATQPGLDEKLYPPYKIALLVELLREDGVAPEAALQRSGIEPAALALPTTRTSCRQLLTVFENAIALTRDPAIALRAGRRMHITHYGLYGYALLSSPSVRAACEFAIRYHRLATPTVNMQLREQDGVAVWEFESAFELDRASALYRFIIEFQFAVNYSLYRDVSNSDDKPKSVRAVYPAPAHAPQYETYLQCAASFGQPANELRFDAAVLDRQPSLANPITAAMLRESCDRLLGEMQTSVGVAAKVHGILLQHPGQFPSEEAVAGKLHMVSRSLRRKLAAEGTSYKQILSDVRKQIALKYLRETRMSTEDIAVTLGFSDASSFRQAFKRWTDRNPSDFRTP